MLEADYSHALQLLLKYPAPEAPHGPHTFVDDALFLRDHYNTPGGSSVIMKYTGRTPSPPSDPRPATPTESRFSSLSIRGRAQGARSPLASPARFISQRGGVEALFQGAAKNVIERGEKLGINQAVRDAMGEIRRNMAELRVAGAGGSGGNSRAATPVTARRDPVFANGLLASAAASSPLERRQTAATLERRNRQLAALLDEAVAELKAVAASNLDGDREKHIEAVEMAAAKTQFVKIYLEDSSLDLDLDPPLRDQPAEPGAPPQVVIEDDLVPGPASEVSPGTTLNQETSSSLMMAEDEIMTDSEAATGTSTPKVLSSPVAPAATNMEGLESSPPSPSSKPHPASTPSSASPRHRPAAIPTRSTFARSSFTWMLEPGEITTANSSASAPPPLSAARSPRASIASTTTSTKRPSNAFLFGEVVSAADDTLAGGGGGAGAGGLKGGKKQQPFTSEDIFGLEPLRRPSKARGKYEDLFGGALGDG